MLHELLMCLLGNTGGLFQFRLENSKSKIKLVDNLEYLHPAEVAICNRLADLGNIYAQMSHFVCQYSSERPICDVFHDDVKAEKQLKFGLYLQTLCDALNQIVLIPYSLKISELEKSLLKEHYLNVTFLQSSLEEYYTLFDSLSNMIDELVTKKLHGCQIVDLIYKYTISGNTIIKDTFNKILSIVHVVMYDQLRDWIIYGQLNDKYDEFYICPDVNQNAQQEFKYSSNLIDEDLGSLGLDQIEELYIGNRFSSNYSQFTFSSIMLPSYLNLKVANMILFTGELLQLFQGKFLNDIYASSADDMNKTTTRGNDPNKTVNGLNTTTTASKNQYISEFDKSLKYEFNIMNEKLDVFSKEIHELSQQEFSLINFEALITRIRNHVSESVWQLIVEKYQLLNEFQKLKYMFLIGRGELFATFFESTKTLLNKVVDTNFEYNANHLFQKSISRMLLDDETWLGKFRIIANEENSLRKDGVKNGWSLMGLSYKVEWPFHSLITKKVLKKYNEIFSYLSSIRRVQIELNQCFLLQMSSKRLKKCHIDPKIWLTRNHMSFLIDNLQFYLQADVLETQYMELENKIKNSKDFGEIRYSHDTFLSRIQAQSFMHHKTVFPCFNDILDNCLLFCSLVQSSQEQFPNEKIQNTIKEFQMQTQVLYKTLKSLEKRQVGPHLEQLLTRINFNNYLSDHNGFIIT